MNENGRISLEEIGKFMDGRDPEERIVNLLYSYQDPFITIVYRNKNDQKCTRRENFYPFVWATLHACQSLCGGDRVKLKSLMMDYSIGVKKLRTTNQDGQEIAEFNNGYTFMFYATKPMCYSRFLKFFKDCNYPIQRDKKDKKGNDIIVAKADEAQFLTVTPQEQFMISTGKRFFKGYTDYNDLLRMIFDLETEGLDPRKHRIKLNGIRMNRAVTINGKEYKDFERIFDIKGKTKEEKDKSELKVIDTMLRIIYTFKPDVITAHNGENFDWNFLIVRCEMLGTTMEEMSKPYFEEYNDYIRKETRESSLKLGGEVESFYRTIVPNTIITDSLHAVRRAQATDSNFLKATLKYATKYLHLKKDNRVYTPGDKIDQILSDTVNQYAFNNTNGDWYLYDPNAPDSIVYKPEYDLSYFQQEYEKEIMSLGGLDNIEKQNYKDYIEHLKEEIFDSYLSNENNEDLCDIEDYPFTDAEIEEWKKEYTYEEWKKDYSVDDEIKTPEQRYQEYLHSIDEKNKMKLGKDGDKPFVMYTRNFIAEGYEIVSGRYIIERYLKDDLWECDKVEYTLNTTNFFICKTLPVPFAKCCTMGTAGQWKAIMMAWSYENNLAIPKAENTGAFTGGLSRLMCVGYIANVIKLDYNSLYPSIILTWGISDVTDLMGAMLLMLEYVLTTREKYKGQKKAANKIVEKYENEFIAKGIEMLPEQWKEYVTSQADYSFSDRKQNQQKVFGNSFFGSYGSNNGSVFPWKSPKCAEMTTCIGRQSLRLMISHFAGLGYRPIVGDTDGFNFKLPESDKFRYTDEHPYIGKGLSRETKEGKEYTGFEADVAEFNDTYMRDFHYTPNAVNKMGLGIDEVVSATINFSRKNYADYFPTKPYPEDVKLVGNTIKSKKMPEYISKFLAIGIRQLLRGEGRNFIDEYYNYLEKIYNYQIPLRDIATKGKIKKSLDEYKKDVKTITKAGRPKSRQAWYELAIDNNLQVNNGDTIYYINTGKSKSHSDIKKVTHYYIINGSEKVEITKDIEREYKKYKKELKETGSQAKTKLEWLSETYPKYFTEDEVIKNCMLVPAYVIDAEEDIFCDDENNIEYNVAKYIDMFNKRIKPLLVCFDRSIRDKILIDNPNNRHYFTEEECEMSSGQPNKISDQDTYEQLMTMEDKELKFWTKYDLVPPFIEECHMGKWEDIKSEYFTRMEEERRLGIDKEREAYNKILNELTKEEREAFEEDGDIPSEILKFVEIDPITGDFVSKKYTGVKIGTMYDIIDSEQPSVFTEKEEFDTI